MLIITTSDIGTPIADKIFSWDKSAELISINSFTKSDFDSYDKIVFIGALGICVRKITPFLNNKHTDPAIVCIDSTGKFVISVASGHVGGANQLTEELASLLGTQAVVTTLSDRSSLWPLDLIGAQFGWKQEVSNSKLNEIIKLFVNKQPTALCYEIFDSKVERLLANKPEHVSLFTNYADINPSDFKLIIAISPFSHDSHSGVPTIWYRPQVLSLGLGCRKNCNPEGIPAFLKSDLIRKGISPDAVRILSTIDLKKNELLVDAILNSWDGIRLDVYTADELKEVEVANPSTKVREAVGVESVAEACAIKSSGFGPLLVEKQKCSLKKGSEFTYAVAIDSEVVAKGHIEIVGAGPGDPDLISVRGRKFLEKADLILYAGSLVPKELTFCAKPNCVVKSSADMTLEEQFELMKKFYDKGKLVVRLHTGDPCIYGAIQEQMAFFDEYGMDYHITPGISSFLAAAAELKSQFTIPEKTQTIILTRGEGNTPMPDRERLSELARSKSTMCIFLSANIVESVQEQLMEHYPSTTPVAVCYKLTWKEQRIYRGQLEDLAAIVRSNGLKLTTLIVVGDAIDNRSGLSRLYDSGFSHLFRKKHNN